MTDVKVEGIVIPPRSTIGYGFGLTDDGSVAVIFAGDQRAMSELGRAISTSDEPIVVDVPEWAIIDRHEL